MGRFFGGWGFNDLVSPLHTPSPTASRRSNTPERSAQLKINNRIIDVPPDSQQAVRYGADRIRASYLNGLYLKKELILNPDLLIPLLNHAKLYWHDWLAKHPGETNASERIESVFIKNHNLSKEQSDWVEKTISDYKNTVEMAVSQNTPRPIAPPPPITSVALEVKCPCNTQ